MTHATKRYLFFWLSYTIGYLAPLIYFLVKLGVTKKATSIVMPVVLLALLAIIKLSSAIPKWIQTWKPSFVKGLVKAIPVYLLFICLTTIGLTLKVMLEQQIIAAFNLYFEVVFVVFGSLCVAAIFDALHLKYKELDMIEKGYVLGVVNK